MAATRAAAPLGLCVSAPSDLRLPPLLDRLKRRGMSRKCSAPGPASQIRR
jgi:hypothetical protein